jgi:hypothetical protein
MQAPVNDQKDGQENLTTTAIRVNVIAVTARLIWSLYDRNDGLAAVRVVKVGFDAYAQESYSQSFSTWIPFLQWQHQVFTVRNTRSALSVLY